MRRRATDAGVRDALPAPRLHLFVCANRREAGSPLGPGCGERGEALYDELKRGVATRAAFGSIWVTKTHCLGVCPKSGATVAAYPSGRVLADVDVADADTLLAL
jgi:hypothetical protein